LTLCHSWRKGFFSKTPEPIVLSDEEALAVTAVLGRALRRGKFIQRGGMSTLYNFRFDLIYGS